MGLIKTKQELDVIVESGKILSEAKKILVKEIKPGVTLAQLDQIAESEVKKLGGESAFPRVPGYKWTTCINVNDGLVHGIPGKYVIREGDKISVDIGVYLRGFYTDSAFTVGVSPVSESVSKFIEFGKRALAGGISEAKDGNHIGDISRAIEDALRIGGYNPVYMFTGHGVGQDLHEEPAIPCFLSGKVEETPLIRPGMVLAIEAIYTEGKPTIKIDQDGWTARTIDGKMGGLFEETLIVTERGPQVVTNG